MIDECEQLSFEELVIPESRKLGNYQCRRIDKLRIDNTDG